MKSRILAFAMFLMTTAAFAAMTPDEVALLGKQKTRLTPVGAERAGNASGTIPEWTGGITTPPTGYQTGGLYIDPYASEVPLFTITAQNYKQYLDNLTEGQVQLFKSYPETYVMHVYPTHRSAAFPEWVYDRTIKYAAEVKQCDGPPNISCLKVAPNGKAVLPFPIPKTGHEIAFNMTFKYQGMPSYQDHVVQPVVNADGTFYLTELHQWQIEPYWIPDSDNIAGIRSEFFQQKGSALYCVNRDYFNPTRIAGQIIAGCSYVEDQKTNAYIYLPGQRRVRKGPKIGFYDQPSTGSDGLVTPDTAMGGYWKTDGVEWYDWKMEPKKEVFIAYNNYKLMNAMLNKEFTNVFHKFHINPELVRFELHRTWPILGTILPAYRHISPTRKVYADEDSWYGMSSAMYNSNGEMFRYVETFLSSYYELPVPWPTGDASYNFDSRRYSSNPHWALVPTKFNTFPKDYSIFTPQGIRRQGTR